MCIFFVSDSWSWRCIYDSAVLLDLFPWVLNFLDIWVPCVVMHVLRITFRVGFVFSTFLDKLAKTWFLFCTRTYLELQLLSWNYTEHWLEKFWGRGDTCILKLECSLPVQFVFGALLPESWICVYCFRNWFFVGKRRVYNYLCCFVTLMNVRSKLLYFHLFTCSI